MPVSTLVSRLEETNLDFFDVAGYFKKTLQDNPDIADAVAAIQALIELIKLSPAITLQELLQQQRTARVLLTKTECSRVTAVNSGCELFLRFVTMTSQLDNLKSFDEVKKILIERGQKFLELQEKGRQRIANSAVNFIANNMNILTHSRSRVVYEILKSARNEKKHFTVYCTISEPDQDGLKMAKDLENIDVRVVRVLDAAVGYIMEKMDFVLVGAEGVCQSGGIINKIGTYTMAVCAKEKNKALYVAAESVKFAKIFPLNQDGIPEVFKFSPSKVAEGADLSKEHPRVDYTPPELIRLMFTDLGILTPSAVSDELIKLYL